MLSESAKSRRKKVVVKLRKAEEAEIAAEKKKAIEENSIVGAKADGVESVNDSIDREASNENRLAMLRSFMATNREHYQPKIESVDEILALYGAIFATHRGALKTKDERIAKRFTLHRSAYPTGSESPNTDYRNVWTVAFTVFNHGIDGAKEKLPSRQLEHAVEHYREHARSELNGFPGYDVLLSDYEKEKVVRYEL